MSPFLRMRLQWAMQHCPLFRFLFEHTAWDLPFILEVSVTIVEAVRARVAFIGPESDLCAFPNRVETLRGIPTQDEILTMGYLQSKHVHARILLRLGYE